MSYCQWPCHHGLINPFMTNVSLWDFEAVISNQNMIAIMIKRQNSNLTIKGIGCFLCLVWFDHRTSFRLHWMTFTLQSNRIEYDVRSIHSSINVYSDRSLLILLLYVFKSSTRWQTIVADDCGKVLFWNDCIFDYDIQLNSILSMNDYNRELTYE